MKRQTKTWLIIITIIIIFTNLPPVNYFLQESYSYQNKDGSFKYIEESGKGLDFEVGLIRFNRFKKDNPYNKNRTLYRTFIFKPWRFWEWYQMISNNERYELQFLK